MVEQVGLEIRLETGSTWLMLSFCDGDLRLSAFILEGSGVLNKLGMVAHLGWLS